MSTLNDKKQILFRADAYPSIGTGDLLSCIYLSHYLEDFGWRSHFIIKDSLAANRLMKEYSIDRVTRLAEGCKIEDDVYTINRYVSSKGIDALFFNITAVPLTSYSMVTQIPVIACACFDGNIFDGVDMVLNWDVGGHHLFQMEKHPSAKFFLGPRYALLPRGFDNLYNIEKRDYKERPETALIFMGGADENNYTQKVVDVFIKQGCDLKLRIIVGAGYSFTAELKDSLLNVSTRCEIVENCTDMLEEYMNCDIAVSAGGLAAYELAATMTPAILIATAGHQQARAIYLEKRGIAAYHGCKGVDPCLLKQQVEHPVIPKERICFNGVWDVCRHLHSLNKSPY